MRLESGTIADGQDRTTKLDDSTPLQIAQDPRHGCPTHADAFADLPMRQTNLNTNAVLRLLSRFGPVEDQLCQPRLRGAYRRQTQPRTGLLILHAHLTDHSRTSAWMLLQQPPEFLAVQNNGSAGRNRLGGLFVQAA